jgi:uncharacterized protein (TIGR03437 family)
VSINAKPGYLSYLSPSQINLQVPDDVATGTINVVVMNSTGSVTAPVVLAPISPSFLIWDNAEHVTAYIPTPIGTGAYGGGA